MTDIFGQPIIEPTGTECFAHDKTNAKEEWLTPRFIIDDLGEFDLDPCASVKRPWSIGSNNYTIYDNGLIKPWHGRVFLNPPYGRETSRWIQKMATHPGGGIALIFVRTETETFFPWIWDYAAGFLFIKGRLNFLDCNGKESGPAGAPSMLIAYSDEDNDILARIGRDGFSNGRRGKFLMNECVKGT